MIDSDVMGWIAMVLNEHTQGSSILQDYSLEYTTALLMNLCLRTKGKIAAENAQPDLLTTLSNLMECQNQQARNYINGTVYSLLTRSNLRERAMEIRLDETLQKLKKSAPEQFKRQMQFILDQLISSSGEQLSDDDDDDDESDEFEEAALNLDESSENDSLTDYVNGEQVR